MVEEIASLPVHFISGDIQSKKNRPHIKANRDKNKSQRIGDFRLKIALFCQPNNECL
jgi:hypothetical protein